MQWIYHLVQDALMHWGYLAVAVAVFAESFGLPLPGETVLVFASFLSHKHTGLHLYWIVPIGSAAAILGDNLGFFLGRRFGRTWICWVKKVLHVDDMDVGTASDLIRRHGWTTIFTARFVFGLRTIAGPTAGALGMHWRRFLSANISGAIAWVTAIACVGFLFGSQFRNLLSYFEKAGWAIAAGIVITGYFVWRRQKRNYTNHHRPEPAR